ncbi:MAG: hypothetical protein SOX32_07750 [Candidatus Choladocola sp.]|nr:hypothetical protein [Candidatus Choladocola sp.]
MSGCVSSVTGKGRDSITDEILRVVKLTDEVYTGFVFRYEVTVHGIGGS